MERENFYILLDLSVDPPETDTAVIEQAIKKKKSEWSKLRNHPTKGLQAQKNISLIPEIEKVMFNPSLREEELEAARSEIKKGRESKWPEIDRHIDILMGKGFISQEEIVKLARVHSIDESQVQDRINRKKQEKYGHIDRAISLRMDKGYLTEAEVARIAKKSGLSDEEVRKRVRCPIRKDSREQSDAAVRHMDKSLEKTINDNLKILGKSSLYDFLDLPESADLESLQAEAERKKKEYASISRKDASVTAGKTLAGHCMTVFKNDETRNSYDITLARSRLAALDSDIDIAAINGRIRSEYYEVLVQKALEFGMDQQEAESYISSYSRRKGYKIEKKPGKTGKKLIIGGIAAAVLAAAAAAGLTISAVHKSRVRESRYEEVMARVSRAPAPEKKLEILDGYLSGKPPEEYAEKARQKAGSVREQMKRQEYAEASERAERLAEEGSYEKAADVYRQYIENNRDSGYIKKAEKQIEKITAAAEEKAYEELRQTCINADTDKKIAACRSYMEKFSGSEHSSEVKKTLRQMSGEYFVFVKNRLEELEEKEDWEGCISLAESYMELYDNSNSDLLRQRIPEYKKRLRDEKILANLREKAQARGEDYKAAEKIYRDYLEAYPDTTVKEEILSELEDLDAAMQKKRIEEAKEKIRAELGGSEGRFREESEGAVLDVKTGLMWTLADSSITHPDKCFTYEEAKSYVKRLDAGGYKDWRLPTARELAGIYKQKPYFPSSSSKWYWSSESYKSYSGGWHTIVETVTGKNTQNWNIDRRDAAECGAVRAVRNAGEQRTQKGS